MTYTLLHPPTFDPRPIARALETEGVAVRTVTTPAELLADGHPTVFLLDPGGRRRFPPPPVRRFTEDGGAVVVLGAEGDQDLPAGFAEDVVSAFVPHPCGPRQLLVALRTAYREAAARLETHRAREEAAFRTREIQELTRIGMALATERDYNTLLDLILSQARQITGSDAGSLYLAEAVEGGSRHLRFKLSQNHSRPDIPFVEFVIPVDPTSIAGYVATTGEPLVIDDAYVLPPQVEYSINRSFDEKYGYRTKSLLTIPMKDHKEAVIGVLQLINRKRHPDTHLETPDDFHTEVLPYTRRLVELVSALAGQAAVSIENSRLYEDIERLFEGFVTAAVTAIEQRDPTTFGHSGRVATMTVGLAETVDQTSDGPYRHVSFSREEVREIRYAALLHDFGKVAVREQVLVKAKKLYPPDLALIRRRYAFIRRTAELEFERRRADFLEQHGRDGYDTFLRDAKGTLQRQLDHLERFMQLVAQSNEPTVLPEGSFEELLRYAEQTFSDLDGRARPYLSDDEVRFLTIRKGSLDEAERLEIESHVTHTYRFLMQIPWTKELQTVPLIAYGHHEKLDGSGYPRRVKGKDIPIQTRMMTVADIYDALTAADRPYKRAVDRVRALDIMQDEVDIGMLDADLVRLFIDAKLFGRTERD